MSKECEPQADSRKKQGIIEKNRNSQRIALIGLDGSGKSANISLLKKDQDYCQYHFIWVRWKPILLWPAYWLLQKRLTAHQYNTGKRGQSQSVADRQTDSVSIEPEKTDDSKTKIKNRIFKKPFVRSIWMSLALIDYLMQFHAKVIVSILMNKKIIFDRFYLDLFVDQGISFCYSPTRIKKEIDKYQWLFPRIDRYLYIKVSPETCLQRKGDIPDIGYLVKRYDVYEQLAKGEKWVTVDGEEPLEAVNRIIKKIVKGESGL